jgi:hypothetical protein
VPGMKNLSEWNVLAVEFDRQMRTDKRFGFVLCHELGHLCLHNKISISKDTYEGFSTAWHKLQYRSHFIACEDVKVRML